MAPFPNIHLHKTTVRSWRASKPDFLYTVITIQRPFTPCKAKSPAHFAAYKQYKLRLCFLFRFQCWFVVAFCLKFYPVIFELHTLASSVINEKRKQNKFPVMRKFSPGTEDLGKSINWLEECWQCCNYQDRQLAPAWPSLPLDCFHLIHCFRSIAK